MEPLLAEDFRGVGPAAFVLDRDQWLVRFEQGLQNDAFAIEDAQAREFGAAAVVIGVLAQQTTWAGADTSGRFRVTLVAVRRGDDWKLANIHIGPNQTSPAAGAR